MWIAKNLKGDSTIFYTQQEYEELEKLYKKLEEEKELLKKALENKNGGSI